MMASNTAANMLNSFKNANGLVECLVCQKVFEKDWQYRTHAKSHSRPYACTRCSQRFGLKANLTRHVKDKHVKTVINPHCVFPECRSKNFARKDNLQRHLRKFHGDLDGELYKNAVREHQQSTLAGLVLQAVENGEGPPLLSVLEHGPNMGEVDDRGNTALHIAAMQGDYDSARLLLDFRIDDLTQNVTGDTALHYAASLGHLDIVTLLPTRETAILNKQGQSALHIAASKGHVDVVQYLLQRGMPMNGKTAKGYTPLHEAAMSRHEHVVAVLLMHGADCYQKDHLGRKPLHYAAKSGSIEACKLLIEQAKSVDNVILDTKETLAVAAEHGHYDIVELLLDQAKPAKLLGGLRRATWQGHYSIVKLLLDRGAEVNGWEGEEAVCVAQETRHYDIMKLLVEYGAKVDGFKGKYALQAAGDHGRHDIVLLVQGRHKSRPTDEP